MSFKQFLVLFFMFLAYLGLGAYMFYSIERPLEEERRAASKAEAADIKEMLRHHYANGLPQEHLELLSRLSQYCGKPFYVHLVPLVASNTTNISRVYADEEDTDEEVEEDPYQWSFYNSFLFVMITLSTIGYGNLTPSSHHGRMLDVLYALFGIPFAGIVLAQMADYYGRVFLRSHHRRKSHEYQSRLSLFFDILTYTGLGVIIFIFCPAAIFVYFEDWSFDTGVYYAFITLTTVGYGDLVAGQHPDDSWSYGLYQIMVLVWIMFGLGYMLMIVGVLTRAMKSKKVRKIERKLAHTIKQTQSRIWSEFSHDVNYLRRVLNEMYLLKIQPVYIEKEADEGVRVRRVKSCPNLTEWPELRKVQDKDSSSEEDEEDMQESFKRIAMRRRRGHAENLMTPRVKRTASEGDLSRIDRKATFGEEGTVEPTLLLAKVVDALGISMGSKFSLNGDEAPTRKVSAKMNGIHGFSDEEILASERPQHQSRSRWSLGGRKRTVSERWDSEKKDKVAEDEYKTWGGAMPVDFQGILRMRTNGELRRSSQAVDTRSLSSRSSTSSSSDLKVPQSRMRRMSLAVVNLFSQAGKNKSQEIKELRDSKNKRKSGNTTTAESSTFQNNNNKRLSLPTDDALSDQMSNLTQTSTRRGSGVFAGLAGELTPKDTSIPISPVLEQTSVADLLRLLTSLQATLDPSLPIPNGSQNYNPSLMNRKKLSSNIYRDTMANNLATLFSNSSTMSTPHSTQSTVTANLQRGKNPPTMRTINLFEARDKRERRFSLIPPMDVDHPSVQTHRKDFLQFQKRSRSSQNMMVNSESGSNSNVSNTPPRGSRRTSLSGTARYINLKFQNSLDTLKSGVPNMGSTQGFRKFTVRPVPSTDVPSVPPLAKQKSSASIDTTESPPVFHEETQTSSVFLEEKIPPEPFDGKGSPSMSIQVPTITVEHYESETCVHTDNDRDNSLTEVIVSKL